MAPRIRSVLPLVSGAGPAGPSLEERLDRRSRPGALWHAEADAAVRCVACGHRCLIRPGRRGICKVRDNRDGTLRVPWGYVAGLQSDPIEKKPFFHVLPGSDCLTFGMLGCDFHCGYCQNWLTSQALRDAAAGIEPVAISPDELIEKGVRHGARAVASSYNEPLITAEWAVDVFKAGRPHGLVTCFVSNGNATAEVLDYIRPWTDCYKIDLKAMQPRAYRQLGGVLEHVLDAMRMVQQRGFWLEVVTLVVPGFNDAPDDVRRMADFIAAVSPDIPWHVTAFHQDYRMTDPRDTTAADLMRVCETGRDAGLRYVYAGNLPGRVGEWEHTWCPVCRALLVERWGYTILRNRVTPRGSCPGRAVPCARRRSARRPRPTAEAPCWR